MRTLRIAAAVEAVSLTALLGNVLTAHASAVSALVGPLHGTAYLVVIAATVAAPAAPPGSARRALVPGVGGLLALRRLDSGVRR
ncbi:DUF3817 domain-containing protein [Streptomyces litchfieldiae]|uniref:DUF3817 domain-containing protein n=1 Tax=Streptomyces litchfieldiae TaxID=3075543 RepID=A0ABU2MMA1_9ACTN|nr:DUF3817 domain-containing protein [Streptomyces sp. DSM 44938]MDT0342685.1 hypothetical protein [Streptomyces sp. DSM 44938]